MSAPESNPRFHRPGSDRRGGGGSPPKVPSARPHGPARGARHQRPIAAVTAGVYECSWKQAGPPEADVAAACTPGTGPTSKGVHMNIKLTRVLLVQALLALFLVASSAAAFAASQEKTRAKVKQQSVEDLARLYAAKPQARAVVEGSAGYATFSKWGLTVGAVGGGVAAGSPFRSRRASRPSCVSWRVRRDWAWASRNTTWCSCSKPKRRARASSTRAGPAMPR